jgi:serine/threonine-protein kinase RsbW
VGVPKAGAPIPEVDDMEIKMVLFLPRDAASVPVSRQVLDGCLETLGVTEDTRTDIALALGEACANVVQHAGSGMDYEVLATTRDGKCVIEVVNCGDRGEAPVTAGAALGLPSAEPVPATAEHGRGLKIIDAVVDNLELTGDGRDGTTVHFEKNLSWLPGAAGEHLFSAQP